MNNQHQFGHKRRRRPSVALLLLLSIFNAIEAFTLPSIPASSSPTTSISLLHSNRNPNNDNYNFDINEPQQQSDETVDVEVRDTGRRNTLLKALSIPSSMMLLSTKIIPVEPSHADIEGVVTPSFLSDPNVDAVPATTTAPSASSSSTPTPSSGVTLFKTRSGLQYIDLEKGTGPSPQYGNFVTISYKAYVKLPDGNTKDLNSSLQEYDSDSSYLIKHGNGRMIPGLDEGLHTMKVGGKRRIIIPPKLGYVGPGVLGPLPDSPYGRYRLNRLLDSMVEVRGGNVIFDVELRSVVEDEADQGYYSDDSLTPEQFNTLRVNLQQQAKTAKEQGIGNGFDLLDEI